MRATSSPPASPSRRPGARLALGAVIAAGVALAMLTMGTGSSVAAPAPSTSASATPTATPGVTASATPTSTTPAEDADAVQETATITGTVTTAESGAALPGVFVKAVAADGRRIDAVTSEDGHFTFTEFPVGSFELTATLAGFDEASASGTLYLGAIKHVDLELTRSTTAITLDRTELAAGSTVQLDASGFLAGELIDVEVHSTPVRIASFEADATGALSQRITVPADITAGTHEIVLIGESGRTVAIVVTVTTPDPLIATG